MKSLTHTAAVAVTADAAVVFEKNKKKKKNCLNAKIAVN